MTQHKATPQAWQLADYWNDRGSYAAQCLLELRDRIAALETQRETEKACIQDIYDKLDRLKVQHESNWSRIVKLEERPISGTVELHQQAPAPAGGLVERVAFAIDDAPNDESLRQPEEARAAILAVADWLEERKFLTGACWLREEVKRG
jgi:hypothetical protein